MKTFIAITFISVLVLSCTVKSKPIEYGSDQCTFCKMTIVDKAHGSQVVTNKGRIHNFDAIECMVDFLKDQDEAAFKYILTPDFSNPGTLVDVKSATFIYSKQIPSPMGAYISRFAKRQDIEALPKEIEVQILTWNEIRDAR